MPRRPYSVCCQRSRNREEQAERILIALINAGADLCASADHGLTVSRAARLFDNLPLWAKALKKCGYDYWKDQPPGILDTGNVIELATDTENSEDMDSDTGMNSDEDMDSENEMNGDEEKNRDEGVDSDRDVNSDHEVS